MPTINGTAGNDVLTGTDDVDFIYGFEGADVIQAGLGTDFIRGGLGLDTVEGGDGDDSIYYETPDDIVAGERIDGGAGFDTLFANPVFGVPFGSIFNISGVSLSGIERLVSAGGAIIGLTSVQLTSASSIAGSFVLTTPGAISLSGLTASSFVTLLLNAQGSQLNLTGFTGLIEVKGGAGFDTVQGSAGSDNVDAGGGDDVLYGNGGGDALLGGEGNDTLVGGDGADYLTGGRGNDLFSGTAATLSGDTIYDFSLGDRIVITNADLATFTFSVSGSRLTYSGGSLTLSGGASGIWSASAASEGGVQLSLSFAPINGTEGADDLTGSNGDDAINGLGGDDILDGNDGDDLVDGGSGDDAINGNDGNDTIVGNVGNDVIDGSFGTDTVDYSRESGNQRIFVNLGSTPLSILENLVLQPGEARDSFGNIDTLFSIENVVTGGSDDYVVGNDVDNRIETGNGVDRLIGNGGADIMIGGGGNDSYVFSPSEGDQVVELADGGDDELYLLDQSFSLVGFENFEAVYGQLASGHTFTGNALDNIIAGFSGSDTIYGEDGNDGVYGGSGDDTLFGGEGMDVVSGNSGNDMLVGGNGNDSLSGGNGHDRLTGGAGIDALNGGAGNDIFSDTAADLNGDRINDFSAGDRIVITDASIIGFTFTRTNNILDFSGGSLTLGVIPAGTIIARSAEGGGVELVLSMDVRNDFNGDGRSDILWRNVDGQMSNWLGQANGGFAQNNANAAAVVPTAWQIAGTGDFNGDGRDDILWRNTDGQLSNWLATASGGFTQNNANAAAVVPLSWSVAGTGDFNGDGRDDILWRNSDGTVSDWLGTASGGFIRNDFNAARYVPPEWSVAGTGDFNGDGRDDILWRKDDGTVSNWLGLINGSFNINDGFALAAVSTDWHVAGTGDFNGDGRDDILWRNDNGQLSNWLGQLNGAFVNNGAVSGTNVPLAWSVVATGDYNGDGRDDILWRNSDGTLTDWLANADGGFTANDANAAQVVPTAWHIQPETPIL